VVTWSLYGTLLNISQGDLLWEHPTRMIMDIALDKTIHEFKMWPSMSRKPGAPSEYMRLVYNDVLAEIRLTTGQEKHPEILAEKVWETIIKKLMQNEYQFDTNLYGPLSEFVRKVAYFFHTAMQGMGCHEGARTAIEFLSDKVVCQGIIADGQPFSFLHLVRALKKEGPTLDLDTLIPPELRIFSCDVKNRKPSDMVFHTMLEMLQKRGIGAPQVLHIGSSLTRDVAPARRLGMRTGLFAGDKASLDATPEMLKQPATRPDVLLTQLDQITQVVY
jgi:FMN phosphatase YigB (HAD superfamily)